MLISLFTNGDFATRSNDVEADGVEDISHEGSDGALFWSDAAVTQPLSSLSGISLASVTEESGGASYTFYMTSPNIGSGSFTASFTLPSRLCGRATLDFRDELKSRKITNRSWFDGDINRLAHRGRDK